MEERFGTWKFYIFPIFLPSCSILAIMNFHVFMLLQTAERLGKPDFSCKLQTWGFHNLESYPVIRFLIWSEKVQSLLLFLVNTNLELQNPIYCAHKCNSWNLVNTIFWLWWDRRILERRIWRVLSSAMKPCIIWPTFHNSLLHPSSRLWRL
jgi:hypothetical protein